LRHTWASALVQVCFILASAQQETSASILGQWKAIILGHVYLQYTTTQKVYDAGARTLAERKGLYLWCQRRERQPGNAPLDQGMRLCRMRLCRMRLCRTRLCTRTNQGMRLSRCAGVIVWVLHYALDFIQRVIRYLCLLKGGAGGVGWVET
jgi:hypothetical protein